MKRLAIAVGLVVGLLLLAHLLSSLPALFDKGKTRDTGRFVAPDPGVEVIPEDPAFVTLLDYFAAGREALGEHLQDMRDSDASDLIPALRKAETATVRIRVNYDRRVGVNRTVKTDHGSGVLVQGGRFVLTAGHVVDVFDRREDAEVELVLPDGRTAKGRPVKWSSRPDWAILEFVEPRPRGLPSLDLGQAAEGEEVLVLGYPGQIGLNAAGETEHGNSSDTGVLTALALTCRVDDPRKGSLVPVAGCFPIGGVSGGPVVNAAGEVVGIQISTSTNHSHVEHPLPPGGRHSRVSYSIGATPVDVVAAVLKSLEEEPAPEDR